MCGAVAPRFIFILRHNLRLLSPSFSSHFHHRTLFSSFTRSPSSSSLTPKLKLKASHHHQQQQHIHTQPSQSPLTGTHHPWPEFSRFLSHISSAGYTSPSDAFSPTVELSQAEVSACLSFARDRPNLLRLLSIRDVAVVVQHGTPFMFSDSQDSVSKMKSFLSNGDSTALDSDKANMVDLMKFMLSYASSCLVSSEMNNLYNRNLVESSVRNLFGELFKLSYSTPGPNSFDSVQNQMPGGRFEHTMPPGQNIEMKRGDWICPRCNFMNFARNMKCLECEEARPKRQLTGGEWECPQCDFHNYGRNVACLRCDCKRPGQISLGSINTTSHPGYGNVNHSNTSDIDARLVANEEKARRWFNKVSQLDSNSDINSVIDDEDFPEIMPLRKGVNRFVVSTRKTPLERRLTNAQYKRSLGNNDAPEVKDYKTGESAKSRDTLDDILGRSTGPPRSDYKNMGAEQSFSGERQPSIASNTSHFQDVKGNNTNTLSPFPSYASSGDTDSTQLSTNSSSENVIKDKEREQAEKSDRWFRKIAELNDVPDITSAISDDDFPEIMPMRKGENRFVFSKKKDRSLTTPAYKRRLAMEQSGNTNFVPLVPFPPDYFAKKEKPQADGTDSTDRSNVESSSVSEGTEMSGDATARPEQSPGPSSDQISSKNNRIGSTYAASSSGDSSQDFKRRLAMEQSGNTNFVPLVPFPPDYFAKKEKPQADGTDSTDRSNVESSSVSEGTEMSGDATARPEQSPGPSSDQISSKNNRIGSTYAASSSGDSSQDFKRRLAMEQSGNTNFVPLVPFPPDYFAKKEKPQADGTDSTDRSNVESSSVSEGTEMSGDATARPEQSPGPSSDQISSKNNRIGSTYAASSSGNSSQDFKRRLAMEQSGNTNFVPLVPFPPDYFAKKEKPQADGTDSTDRSNVESSSVSEGTEMSGDATARPEQSPGPSSDQISSKNNRIGSTYAASSSGNSSQDFNQDHVPNLTESSSTDSAAENQSVGTEWSGKSLEGSAVREPDPLDMSEEAKAERWFRRVAQIKDISELSQIPDEDFPSIMPMRKGVNRFVVSKRKTPLERRLTSQQYRRNLPAVSSDPVKRENEGS
ncbi:zinc finger protein VAR3, chloroplastic isoform X3 [Medicago truncatula]|uniref:Zinc finger (Ran-binding) family protein n=2 Tax=Medicago truncatula TaxID=3880 RepID=A0A072U320_MEDTR|nr:zinc finger protein VAR3, chloroplastic isoform X3 [Medicago truncatula]KEH23548.1 zinc finger (Ran-binding) family protein [Medicago truncatula]